VPAVDGALEWLINSISPAGLLKSYNAPHKSWAVDRGYAYAQGLGAIAFMLHADSSNSNYLSHAETVLSELERRILAKNTVDAVVIYVPFSFELSSSEASSKVRSGNAAWVAEAFALHWLLTGKDDYASTLIGICNFLVEQFNLSGANKCVRGGPDVSWCSGEHNIDSYFVLHLAHYLTGDGTYLSVANDVADSLRGGFWNSAQNRFNQGIGDPYRALDVQSWGTVWLMSNDQTASYGDARTRSLDALSFADSFFYSTQASAINGFSVSGYGPYADSSNSFHSEAVWSEGTYGVALAHLRLGDTDRMKTIVNDISSMQNVTGGVLYAAQETVVDISGEKFYPFESVAGSGWLALVCASNQYMFWNATTNYAGIADTLKAPTPTSQPTNHPIASPTNHPIASPTNHPIASPTNHPIASPTNHPIASPTYHPIASPTNHPVVSPKTNPPVDPPKPSMKPHTRRPHTQYPILLVSRSPSWGPHRRTKRPPQPQSPDCGTHGSEKRY